MFNERDYERLHKLVFRKDYSGYKPDVAEIPNGDGKVDDKKRYAHVATKYLVTEQQRKDLMPYLEAAHHLSIAAADIAGVPKAFWPKIENGALRVLDYPPGATSAKHTDFDLFTLMVHRNQPECFVAEEVEESRALKRIHILNKQAHLGEIAELIGLGQATPHEVVASETRQHSIVHFSIPDHAAVLPSGLTVGDWLAERMGRSRVQKYE
jgi:hypothetical protein